MSHLILNVILGTGKNRAMKFPCPQPYGPITVLKISILIEAK
jgi:hypothetical protein